MTTLKVTGDNALRVRHDYNTHLWCGIGSISAALEITTTAARELIKSLTLRKYIKAISYEEMAHALAAGGKKITREYFPRDWRGCPTVKDFIDRGNVYNRVYVICITGHWIVIKNDGWVCSMNQTQRSIDSCPYLQSRVRHVISFDGE